jgi:hypothetical protein
VQAGGEGHCALVGVHLRGRKEGDAGKKASQLLGVLKVVRVKAQACRPAEKDTVPLSGYTCWTKGGGGVRREHDRREGGVEVNVSYVPLHLPFPPHV